MGSYGLVGVFGRIPCPHCGDDDCMSVAKDRLKCCKTKKVVSENALKQQAQKHDLSLYELKTGKNDWELWVVSHVGKADCGKMQVGNTYIYHHELGLRGSLPTFAHAENFLSVAGWAVMMQVWAGYYQPDPKIDRWVEWMRTSRPGFKDFPFKPGACLTYSELLIHVKCAGKEVARLYLNEAETYGYVITKDGDLVDGTFHLFADGNISLA